MPPTPPLAAPHVDFAIVDTTLADPLVGRVLDRRYRIDARLAGGGMGTVYKAVDTRLDRVVAVKVMQPTYAGDAVFVGRFIREAKAAARLSHPNVVAVFDQGSEPGPHGMPPVVFLVMEYVAGGTLRGLLSERGRLAPAQALAVMEPVLSALGAAHAAGLVHRDVKPENVLLAADGRVKVADFGLARAIEASARSASVTMLIGTVAYLAPEQISTGTADTRSDVYAAGVLLYELLTGKPPFNGANAMAVAFRHVHEDVPAPSHDVRGLSDALDDLVSRATARDPAARFADARAFLAALHRVQAAVPGQAPGQSDAADTVVVPAPAPTGGGSAPTRPAPSRAGALPAAGALPTAGALRRHPWWGTLSLLLLTVLAAISGWWLAAGRYAHAPAVLTMTKASATRTLSAAGLRPQWLSDRFHPSVPAGRVALEQPAPGDRVRHGGTVTLALSKGPEVHALPMLSGQLLAAAQQALAADRLRATVTKVYSTITPTGRVVTTRPAAGTLLHPGDLVRVSLSKGRRPVDVPDVRGLAFEDAKAGLGKLGFAVSRTDAFSDTVIRSDVIDTRPSSGDTAGYGTTIALTVSKGPELFPVPDVRGASTGDARRALEAAGFTVRVFQPLGFGSVHVVSPRVGSMVARHTTITLLAY